MIKINNNQVNTTNDDLKIDTEFNVKFMNDDIQEEKLFATTALDEIVHSISLPTTIFRHQFISIFNSISSFFSDHFSFLCDNETEKKRNILLYENFFPYDSDNLSSSNSKFILGHFNPSLKDGHIIITEENEIYQNRDFCSNDSDGSEGSDKSKNHKNNNNDNMKMKMKMKIKTNQLSFLPLKNILREDISSLTNEVLISKIPIEFDLVSKTSRSTYKNPKMISKVFFHDNLVVKLIEITSPSCLYPSWYNLHLNNTVFFSSSNPSTISISSDCFQNHFQMYQGELSYLLSKAYFHLEAYKIIDKNNLEIKNINYNSDENELVYSYPVFALQKAVLSKIDY